MKGQKDDGSGGQEKREDVRRKNEVRDKGKGANCSG